MSRRDQPPLRERKKIKARRAILDAARRLIDDRGYERATMREIAGRAEISYQTLYNYFPTKALILQQILTDRIQHVSHQIDEVLQSYEGGLPEALDAINRIRLELVANEDRALWRIVSIELMRDNHEASEVYQLIDRTAHGVLEALLNQARAAGELEANADVGLLADTLFCLAQQNLSRFLFADNADPEAALESLSRQTRLLVAPYLTPQRGTQSETTTPP
ncbi:MAG: helix-turn-helix domain containing protein [Gammaproteobacteria bacterium]|jgi:AcrR family transcriptional regulator